LPPSLSPPPSGVIILRYSLLFYCQQLQAFFERIKDTIAMDSYVIDFWVGSREILVLELNPFYKVRGPPLLFLLNDPSPFVIGRRCRTVFVEERSRTVPEWTLRNACADGPSHERSAAPHFAPLAGILR